MTTTSTPPGLPTIPAAGTGPAPAPDGEASGPTPALTAAFAAMLDALTTELAAIAGEVRSATTDGQSPAEPTLDDTEPAGGCGPDVAIASALAASPQPVAFVPAGPIEATGAGVPGGAAHIDAIATGPVLTGLAGAGDVAGEGTGGQGAAGGEPVPVPLRFEHPATSAGAPPVVADEGTDGTITGAGSEPVDGPASGTSDAAESGLHPGSGLRRGDATAAASTFPVTDAPGHASVDRAPLGGVHGPAASSSAERPTPALPEQLVNLVTPLRRGADGTHQLSIQLRPEELGGVNVDVRVLGNQISLHLRADVPATTDLLRASLAELRVELEAAGFDAGSLDVGANAQEDPEGHQTDARRPEMTGPAILTPAGVPLDVPTAAPAAGIDIRL